jgi:hypothetical protein
MRGSLPNADEIFAQFFDRWYDDDARQRKGFSHTRPDCIGYREGLAASDFGPFDDEGGEELLGRVQEMLETAKTDWPGYLDVAGEPSVEWVDEFDRYAERVEALVRESDPSDFSNDLLVLVCQFGAVLGTVLREQVPRLEWVAEWWPYWESSLYDPQTGNLIPPFHWAIKKFSSYGIDDGFSAKLDMCRKQLG